MLIVAAALFVLAACSDDAGDSGGGAFSFAGTSWKGSTTLYGNEIPLTLDFTDETNLTVAVDLGPRPIEVTCTYTVSAGGSSISATGTGNYSGNNITMNIDELSETELRVTVASSEGALFSMALQADARLTFTKQ